MYKDKVQLTRMWVVKPAGVEKFGKNLEDHANWMKETHHKEGEKALLVYNLSTGPEIVEEEPTGNTIFVLTEVYQTEKGIDDHFAQAGETLKMTHEWDEFSEDIVNELFCDRAIINHSLW
tara:strand:- start:153 stop:512 length:360 start_codon:yes stop_codon:yes gene_type:complete